MANRVQSARPAPPANAVPPVSPVRQEPLVRLDRAANAASLGQSARKARQDWQVPPACQGSQEFAARLALLDRRASAARQASPGP
jgi:hypothetical protein